MTTLKQRLIEIGYNDSPLRKEVINTFKEWLQQKPFEVFTNKNTGEIKDFIDRDELLEELNER